METLCSQAAKCVLSHYMDNISKEQFGHPHDQCLYSYDEYQYFSGLDLLTYRFVY